MNHTETDCRTEEGITVGLIDSIIAIARLLRTRDLSSDAVKEALFDLKSDSDVGQLFDNHWIVSYLQSNRDDFDYCLGYTRVFADDEKDALEEAERRWNIDHPHRMPIISKQVIKF